MCVAEPGGEPGVQWVSCRSLFKTAPIIFQIKISKQASAKASMIFIHVSFWQILNEHTVVAGQRILIQCVFVTVFKSQVEIWVSKCHRKRFFTRAQWRKCVKKSIRRGSGEIRMQMKPETNILTGTMSDWLKTSTITSGGASGDDSKSTVLHRFDCWKSSGKEEEIFCFYQQKKKCRTGFEVCKESREKAPVSAEVVVTVCALWRWWPITV